MTRLRCDVPGCASTRRRHQRLCDGCYRRLPGDIRTGIIDARRQHRTADWRALCRRAAAFLQLPGALPRVAPAPSPEQVFERTARFLGERP